jgi:ribonuclease P protein component
MAPPPQAPAQVPSGAAASPSRLTRRAEFLRVASTGRKLAMPGLVLQVMKRADNAPVRLGFTVTRKIGNAVIRNRTKRRLREAARLLLRETPLTGADLVLVGRDKTRDRPFTLLIDDLRQALARNGLPPREPAS